MDWHRRTWTGPPPPQAAQVFRNTWIFIWDLRYTIPQNGAGLRVLRQPPASRVSGCSAAITCQADLNDKAAFFLRHADDSACAGVEFQKILFDSIAENDAVFRHL